MADQLEFSRKWSWRADLSAYDDGLGETRQPSQKLLFSSYENRKTTRTALIDSLKDGTARGTTDLPTSQELNDSNPRARLGLWVGWYLPLELVSKPSPAIQGLSIKKLVEKQASEDQVDAVSVSRSSGTALKAIFPMTARKRLDYFALAEPDPTTGICKAFQITGATKAVYFFPEFRDQADDLVDARKRSRAWDDSVLTIAGKKSDSHDEQEDEEGDDNGGNKDKGNADKLVKQKSAKAKAKSKGVSMPPNDKSAVNGAGVGTGSPLGIQTPHSASATPSSASAPAFALAPIDASLITRLKARLADLRSKMTLNLYNEIRDEVGTLTKVEFPVFPSSTYLDAFIHKKRLKKRHAKLAVNEFFCLYPYLKRESLPNLNHFLVHVASIVMSSDTEGIIALSWDTIQDFLLTLAYICDARYAAEPELKRKVFLAFEMVRKEAGVFSQSKEIPPRDEIQDFLSGVIDNMERQLVVYAENCRLAASFGEGTHTTGAAIVDRWVKRLREQPSNLEEPARPFKILQQLVDDNGLARPFKRLRQLVDDDDDTDDMPETELSNSGSSADLNGTSLVAAKSAEDSAGTSSHHHVEGENLGLSSRPALNDIHEAHQDAVGLGGFVGTELKSGSYIVEQSTAEVKSGGLSPPHSTPDSDSHLSDPESLVTGPGSPKDLESLAVLQLVREA